jgi:hypothetical protein
LIDKSTDLRPVLSVSPSNVFEPTLDVPVDSRRDMDPYSRLLIVPTSFVRKKLVQDEITYINLRPGFRVDVMPVLPGLYSSLLIAGEVVATISTPVQPGLEFLQEALHIHAFFL